MPLHLGDTAPNFTEESTEGKIDFYQWMEDYWAILFSDPADFTSVCTTELGTTANLKKEFEKRRTKVLVVSVDPVSSHKSWIKDINETQHTIVNSPILGDADKKASKLYDLIYPKASDTPTARSVYVIDPQKKFVSS